MSFAVASAVPQAFFQGWSAHIQAGATRSIANTYTTASISMANTRRDATIYMANSRASSITEQARLRSYGILAAANVQYLQQRNQMRFDERAEGRTQLNWRLQVGNDLKAMTVMASAELHANQAASVNRKLAIMYEGAAQKAEQAQS